LTGIANDYLKYLTTKEFSCFYFLTVRPSLVEITPSVLPRCYPEWLTHEPRSD
jgi:hypothetical protein